MRQAVADTAAEFADAPAVPADKLDEDLAFLEWLANGNFTLLGQRDYDLVAADGEDTLRVSGTGLGILRVGGNGGGVDLVRGPARRSACAGAWAACAAADQIERPRHGASARLLDYIGVKRFDAKGQVLGERRFVGLYTSTAYNANPAEIPLLRRKVAAVTARAGFLPNSHAAKALVTILDQYPRDELFQIEAGELYATAMGILRLGERQRTRLFLRRDAFGRFVSCLVYVPRENYNTDLRSRMQALLSEALQGVSSEFSVQFSDSPLARVLIVVRTRGAVAALVDVRELEQRLAAIARSWDDGLRKALVEACGEERGNALCERYARGFAAGYRDDHAPRVAVRDIELMESLAGPDALAMSLYVPLEAQPGRLRFKLVRAGQLAPLSQSLPMLEHMGVQVLEERPYEVKRGGQDGGADDELWIDDFGMRVPGRDEIDVERLRARFQETVARTWRGDNDNDDFNRLVLLAGLDWRGVTVLRAYARYMKQAAFTFSQAYIEQALATHATIAADLVALFMARFDPALAEDRAAMQPRIAVTHRRRARRVSPTSTKTASCATTWR